MLVWRLRVIPVLTCVQLSLHGREMLLYARAGSAPSVCEVKHVVTRRRNIFVMEGKKILILSRISFPDHAFARFVCVN